MDWYKMKVNAEKMQTKNEYRFTIGNDVIEAEILFIDDCFFENLSFRVINHFIKGQNNKPSSSRTLALTSRVYAYLRLKYLEELKKSFCKIASEPSSAKLSKDFYCLGSPLFKGSSPEELFSWFFKHYTSTCASGDMYELVMQASANGFFGAQISDYIQV